MDRWDAIGRGRPVWMVLQAFSWHVAKSGRTRLYPTFAQSRFMAYDSIAHGDGAAKRALPGGNAPLAGLDGQFHQFVWVNERS